MKAEIEYDGMFTIQAESELEGYALSKWIEENGKVDCPKLTIISSPGVLKP